MRPHAGLLPLLCLLLAGCSRGGSSTETPSSNRAPLPPAASVARAVEPAPRAAPAAPPGADPEEVRLLSSICPAAYRLSESQKKPLTLLGCRVHPPFDVPERQSDGTFPLYEGDDARFCQLVGVRRGSFTRPGTKEAIVDFGSCKDNDDSGWNGSMPGSAVLVEEIGGTWRSVAYEPNVSASGCHAFHRRDGHDALLCQGGFWGSYTGEMTDFFLLDFAREKKRAGAFAWLFSDVLVCPMLETTNYHLPSGFASVRVTSTSLADVNGDGTPDLIVEVERARAAPSPGLDAKARAVCTQHGNEKTLVPQGKKTRLELVSTGEIFAPSAASQKLLDAWEAEGSFGYLKGAAPAPPRLAD